MKYDPTTAPAPGKWLTSNEQERLDAVLEHHAAAGAKLPNERLHAALHVVVENQIAEGYPATVRAVGRLMAQGHDRHDTLHAIGNVVALQMHAHLARGAERFETESYDRALDALDTLRPRPAGP